MTGVSASPAAQAGRRAVAVRALTAVLVAVVTLLVTWVAGAVPHAAASCGQPVAAEVVRWADVIVVGRITEVDDPGASYSPHPVSWTVEVATVHQGRAPRVLHVESDDMTTVPVGDRYVVPLRHQEGRMTVASCALIPYGTTWGDALLAAAGPGRPPVGGEAATALPGYAPIDLGSGWSPTGIVVAVLGAALALALLGAAVVGLRRARAEAGSGRAATHRPGR